jgi:hypothetical protein
MRRSWLFGSLVVVAVVAIIAWRSLSETNSSQGVAGPSPPSTRSEESTPGAEVAASAVAAVDPGSLSQPLEPVAASAAAGGSETGTVRTPAEYGLISSLDDLSPAELSWVKEMNSEKALMFRGLGGLVLIAAAIQDEQGEYAPLVDQGVNANDLRNFAELLLSRQDAIEGLAQERVRSGEMQRYATFAQAEQARVDGSNPWFKVIVPVDGGCVLLEKGEFGEDPGVRQIDQDLRAVEQRFGVGTVQVFGITDFPG